MREAWEVRSQGYGHGPRITGCRVWTWSNKEQLGGLCVGSRGDQSGRKKDERTQDSEWTKTKKLKCDGRGVCQGYGQVGGFRSHI